MRLSVTGLIYRGMVKVHMTMRFVLCSVDRNTMPNDSQTNKLIKFKSGSAVPEILTLTLVIYVRAMARHLRLGLAVRGNSAEVSSKPGGTVRTRNLSSNTIDAAFKRYRATNAPSNTHAICSMLFVAETFLTRFRDSLEPMLA
jgi:hypothetical protein